MHLVAHFWHCLEQPFQPFQFWQVCCIAMEPVSHEHKTTKDWLDEEKLANIGGVDGQTCVAAGSGEDPWDDLVDHWGSSISLMRQVVRACGIHAKVHRRPCHHGPTVIVGAAFQRVVGAAFQKLKRPKKCSKLSMMSMTIQCCLMIGGAHTWPDSQGFATIALIAAVFAIAVLHVISFIPPANVDACLVGPLTFYTKSGIDLVMFWHWRIEP